MSSASPYQKRKRGRPVSQSATRRMSKNRTATASAGEGQRGEGDRADPRKRGRRALEDKEAQTTEDEPVPQTKLRRRGRPPAQDAVDQNTATEEGTRPRETHQQTEMTDIDESSQPRRSTRDRTSLEGAKPWWQAGGAADSSRADATGNEEPSQQIRKQGRPSLADVSVAEAQNKKKRGRPSISKVHNDEAPLRRRRGRPSLDEQPRAPRGKASVPKARGRPRASSNEQQSGAPETIDEPEAAPQNQSKKRKRRSEQQEQEESISIEEEHPTTHRQLVPRVRHIPRATIATKWGALEAGAISIIGVLLAEAERPVLLRLRDTQRRREHASAAVSIVSRRVRSKLAKGMPFPPSSAKPRTTVAGPRSGHEDDLDYERIVNSIQSLERTLTPLLHSVALLTQEKEREEHSLEQDYAALKTLEANARSEVRSWREKIKKAHALAPEVKGGELDASDSPARAIIGREDLPATTGVFRNLQDRELFALSEQLSNHMDSMKGNLQQIEGVVPGITGSRAALQQVLHKHLDPQQYERVLLG